MARVTYPRPGPVPELKYLRAPQPIHFPEEAEVPEGKRHLGLRLFLFRVLQYALSPIHSVGSDQFVYWNGRDPRPCLSPCAFVKLGIEDTLFGSWKTWANGGAPELAVEIISPNEGDGIDWDVKLARYHELGVKELVRFDPEEPAGKRLRVWDRVREDLVERLVVGEQTPCVTLGVTWVIRPFEGEPAGLRLIDEAGNLLEAPEEAEARAREAAERARAAEAKARAEAEARAAAETKAREGAERRIRELERELAGRPAKK